MAFITSIPLVYDSGISLEILDIITGAIIVICTPLILSYLVREHNIGAIIGYIALILTILFSGLIPTTYFSAIISNPNPTGIEVEESYPEFIDNRQSEVYFIETLRNSGDSKILQNQTLASIQVTSKADRDIQIETLANTDFVGNASVDISTEPNEDESSLELSREKWHIEDTKIVISDVPKNRPITYEVSFTQKVDTSNYQDLCVGHNEVDYIISYITETPFHDEVIRKDTGTLKSTWITKTPQHGCELIGRLG